MKIRRLYLPATAICLAACAASDAPSLSVAVVDTLPGGIVQVMSPGPTAWADTTGWKLVVDGALEGDLGSPGELINPQSWAVDERGYVYVADAKPAIIKVFDDSGRFVKSFGREGAGPGEFRAAFVAAHGGKLVVHDPREARTSVFDTSGTFVRSWVSACCYYTQISVDDSGRIYVSAMNPPDVKASHTYIRYDTLGAVVDTLLLPEVPDTPSWSLRKGGLMIMSTSVPFTAGARSALPPAGGIVSGWSGDYRLALTQDGRDTTRVFGRAWTPEPIEDARREAEYERRLDRATEFGGVDEATVRAQFDEDLIPHSLPAFTGISIDRRGYMWVHLDEGDGPTRFDVFDPAGVYLGRVQSPITVSPYSSAWGSDVVYVRNDTEDGYPRISRLRIQRPE